MRTWRIRTRIVLIMSARQFPVCGGVLFIHARSCWSTLRATNMRGGPIVDSKTPEKMKKVFQTYATQANKLLDFSNHAEVPLPIFTVQNTRFEHSPRSCGARRSRQSTRNGARTTARDPNNAHGVRMTWVNRLPQIMFVAPPRPRLWNIILHAITQDAKTYCVHAYCRTLSIASWPCYLEQQPLY